MRFAFTDDQLALRDAVRAMLAKECPPSVVRGAWPGGDVDAAAPVWAQLAEMGVLGVAVPEAVGGLGLDELAWVLLAEEAGRAALPLPLVDTVAVAAPVLAGDDRWSDLLGAIVAGDVVVTVQLDPGAAVPFAQRADRLLLRAGEALHLVARADARLRPVTAVDGSRALAHVEWQPSSATLVNDDPAVTDRAFDRGAVGAAAELIGLGHAMVDLTVEYVTGRRQFGVPVGSFQAVKHHLADARLALEFARPAVHRAAHSLTTDAPTAARDASMAKAMASDAGSRVAAVALQCHGAMGYTTEYDLHLWMKRTWALARSWGAAAYHRSRVADALGV